jgi:hypothetical protein
MIFLFEWDLSVLIVKQQGPCKWSAISPDGRSDQTGEKAKMPQIDYSPALMKDGIYMQCTEYQGQAHPNFIAS